MGGAGYIHSAKLYVVERLHREGDTLVYEATADDPEMLSKPWVMSPRTLKLGTGIVEETPLCEERDESHLQFFHR